jgi:hypothetical protein
MTISVKKNGSALTQQGALRMVKPAQRAAVGPKPGAVFALRCSNVFKT